MIFESNSQRKSLFVTNSYRILESMLLLPEDVVWNQGDFMTDPNNFFLYFVCSGQCEVYVNSEDETKKVCFDSLNQF